MKSKRLAQDALTVRGFVEFKLDSWGQWSTGSLGIGYPSTDMTVEYMGRSVQIAPLSDSEGMQIEGVMTALLTACPDARRAAIMYYQRRLPMDKIGPYETVCQMLDVARNAVAVLYFPGIDLQNEQC